MQALDGKVKAHTSNCPFRVGAPWRWVESVVVTDNPCRPLSGRNKQS